MDINTQAVDNIIKAIEERVKKYMETVPLDITKRGIITSVLGSSKYKVKIQGAEYTVPCATSQTFQVNDTVLVLLVQGNMNDKHIIGKG